MNYTEIISKLKPGQIIGKHHSEWGTEKDLESHVVMMATESEYSHVAMVFGEIQGEMCVIEAVSEGVRLFPLRRMLPFKWVPLDVIWTPEATEFVVSHMGDEYSKWQAILADFHDLDIGSDRKWECAELLICIAKILNINLGSVATPSGVMSAAQKTVPIYSIEGDI